ncbi:MAG: hypothetical protein ACD_62C00373G0002 [uncultured bacterium]|nr:MAG: hypothetical protein ACD_62C00373G0002 [uncultured bacterium]
MKGKLLQIMLNEESLQSKLEKVDEEFKDYLDTLSFRRDLGGDKLKTFSPIDAVEDFEQDGIFAVREITREEMMAQDTSFNKLLANMLQQCKPGALSDEDVNQISGINGREMGV